MSALLAHGPPGGTILSSRSINNDLLKMILIWVTQDVISITGTNHCQVCTVDLSSISNQVPLEGDAAHKMHLVKSLIDKSWGVHKEVIGDNTLNNQGLFGKT